MTGRSTRLLELRDRVIAGSTPQQLEEAALDQVLDQMLDLVFASFTACFRPERAVGRSGIFHYRVDTPLGPRDRYVGVVDGMCTAGDTPDAQPDATIAVDLADLVRLAAGELSGSDAYIGGRLRISGNIYFAMNWTEWFGAGTC